MESVSFRHVDFDVLLCVRHFMNVGFDGSPTCMFQPPQPSVALQMEQHSAAVEFG